MTPILARALRWSGGLLAGTLAVAGAFSGADALAQHEVSQPVETFAPAPDVELTAAGNITVHVDAAAQRITVRPRARTGFNQTKLQTTRDGSLLDIRNTCPGQLSGSCLAELDVTMPPSTSLRITTDAGEIRVTGAGPSAASTELELVSRSGDVGARAWHGSVGAETEAGAVLISAVTGGVSAGTSTGDILISDVSNQCVAGTFSGTVLIDAVTGNVDASSSTGDVAVTARRGSKPVNLDIGSVRGQQSVTGDTSRSSPVQVRIRSTDGDVYYTDPDVPLPPNLITTVAQNPW